MQGVEVLALVFMKPLDLHVEDSVRIQRHAGGPPHIFRQPELIAAFHRGKVLQRRWIVRKGAQLGQLPGVQRKAVADPLL